MQSHLQETWTAESVLNHAQLSCSRTRVSAFRPSSRDLLKAGHMACSDVVRWIPEEWVKTHVVIGRVKARMVKNIKRLHIKSKIKPFMKFEVLEEGHIDARLEGATEFISACAAKTRLIYVAGPGCRVTRRHTVLPWGKKWPAESIFVYYRICGIHDHCALQ